MSTSLRAFLMLRTVAGEWIVSVHRELEDLLASWKARIDPDRTTGVIHVGFDRPPSRDFEPIACEFSGRALVTVSAKFALPADFRASQAPVGLVGALPVFLATRGWGYLIGEAVELVDTVAPTASSSEPEGWVSEYIGRYPDAAAQMKAANIFGESDYLARENTLSLDVRQSAGLFRFECLIGERRDDPCAFVRAAPPWLVARTFDSLGISVRTRNGMMALGLTRVEELGDLSLSRLLCVPNFGAKSVDDLLGVLQRALALGPTSLTDRSDEGHVEVTPLTERESGRWLNEFIASYPDAAVHMRTADIWTESDYVAREAALPFDVRQSSGLFRFERLIGELREDPCSFARAAPPWLSARAFSSLSSSVRVTNVMALLELSTVGDLANQSLSNLLKTPNFGRKSVIDLLDALQRALDEGPPILDGQHRELPAETTLLAELRRSLLKLRDRDADILRRRMGLDAKVETLQKIGDHYEMTRERARQIESATINRLSKEGSLESVLTYKLKILLRGRDVPMPALGLEGADTWFGGMSEFPEALRYLLANFNKSGANVVSIDGIGYIGLLSQETWDSTLAEARRLLESNAGKGWSADNCRSVVEGLLPSASREFGSLLWEKASRLCHFSDVVSGSVTIPGSRVLTSYGRGVERLVEAILQEADRPLHFSEIAELASVRSGRDIDRRRAHNAAAAVGLLMGRGVYGADRHLPLGLDALAAVGEEAEDIVSNGLEGRQWHASEILEALVEQGSDYGLTVDKYVINIALQRSGRLRALGRMVWSDVSRGSASNELRIDLRQAIISLLQQAGRPLRTGDIYQRLVAIRGVNDTFQISASDPMIRVGPALWGLNDRDLTVKRPDQPAFLDALVEILQLRGFAIHASELGSALRSIPEVSPVAIFSLCATDSRMRVDQAHYLFLTEWGGPRRESIGEAIQSILFAAGHPMSFDDIATLVDSRIRRVCTRSSISAALKAIEATYDQETGLWCPAVADEPRKDDDDDVALVA